MWAGGPPKPITPIRPHSLIISPSPGALGRDWGLSVWAPTRGRLLSQSVALGFGSMRPRGLASVPPPASGAGPSATIQALSRLPLALRAAAIMPAAALAVHQLRYWLAYGSGADRALAAQGHSYLPSLVPWIVLLIAISLGAFLGRLIGAWQEQAVPGSPRHRRNLLWSWLALALALILIYTGQELLEGMFAGGHPAGLAGVLGDGGLWSIPAALAVAALLALLLRGARRAIAFAARAALTRISPSERAETVPAGRNFRLAPLAPLASAAAGRAPPSTQQSPS